MMPEDHWRIPDLDKEPERIRIRKPQWAPLAWGPLRTALWNAWRSFRGESFYEVATREQAELRKQAEICKRKELGLLLWKFKKGEKVHKKTGDYRYKGTVVLRGTKLDGRSQRYVVESPEGMWMIMNEGQLSPGWPDLCPTCARDDLVCSRPGCGRLPLQR